MQKTENNKGIQYCLNALSFCWNHQNIYKQNGPKHRLKLRTLLFWYQVTGVVISFIHFNINSWEIIKPKRLRMGHYIKGWLPQLFHREIYELKEIHNLWKLMHRSLQMYLVWYIKEGSAFDADPAHIRSHEPTITDPLSSRGHDKQVVRPKLTLTYRLLPPFTFTFDVWDYLLF